ncbi:MAG: MarR family winged helix-turn-helix transcriptional regulator [Candidatus Limnocylindria bacterium]
MQEHVDQTTYSGPLQPAEAEAGKRARRASDPEVGAWRAFLRAGTTSTLALEVALADTGVSHSEYDVLVHVATGPRDGLRPTELAERVLITKSGLTRLLDRLVERGYIERRACASDRRGQLIVLTNDGRRAFRRAAPNVVRAIGAIFGEHFSEREVTAFRVACERIAAAAEAMTT